MHSFLLDILALWTGITPKRWRSERVKDKAVELKGAGRGEEIQ